MRGQVSRQRRPRWSSRRCVVVFLLLLCCWQQAVSAFLPVGSHQKNSAAFARTPLSTTTIRLSSTSRLAASRLVPPPPPPPPLNEQDFGTSLSNTFSNLMDKLSVTTDKSSSQPDIFQQLTRQLDDLQIGNNNNNIISSLRNSWSSLPEQLQSLDASILSQLQDVTRGLETSILQDYPQLEPLYQKLVGILSSLNSSSATVVSPSIIALIAVVLSVVTLGSILTSSSGSSSSSSSASSSLSFTSNNKNLPPPRQPYPLYKYDAVSASAYFDGQMFGSVLARGLEIVSKSLLFALSLAKDKLENKMEEREYQRGEELAQLLTTLGPTFIKVGQSLSIRTDLLSPAYARGLATLQDQVSAFDTRQARQILETEWGGRSIESIIYELTPQPIAAASLGQVYKAKLKSTGQEVAIKVQRPNIMNQIALDMYLLRQVAPIIKKLGGLNSDTVGTVDAWGIGFVDELNYLDEAQNAQAFSEFIATTPLNNVVFAPTVISDLTTRSVLVTEWIDGQRLDKSPASDVNVLCSIAMNTYLSMLLEGSGGILHCDPHPGNLLRTPDGRLCILDWGMVTRLDEELQLTLIEHVAHLTSSDYEEIPSDLLKLGFIPPEKAELIRDSGVVQTLAGIYGEWKKGGGAASINVNDVVNQLQDLTAKKGNLFQIPPYFAYIAKSFSVLEGIGLSNDKDYSIIDECLPYISKRLMTDKDRCGPALSTFIFGPEKSKPDRVVDYKRVEQLVEGFGSYTTAASGALLGKENSSRVELLEESAEQILDLILVEEETPLQAILLEQLVKIMASNSRSFLTQIRERSGVLPSGRTVLGTIIDPLGVWRTSPLVRMNEKDEATVETTRKLAALIAKQVEKSKNPLFDLSTLTREESLALASILGRKVWERRNGVVQTTSRFAQKALELTAQKLERGERDTRRLPPPASSTSLSGGSSSSDDKNGSDLSLSLPSGASGNSQDGMMANTVEQDSLATVAVAATMNRLPTTSTASTAASPRLQQARRLLNAIQQEEERNIPEVAPLNLPHVPYEDTLVN